MRYDKKDMAGFGLFAVVAAVIAGVFSGVWPLVGVAIALMWLCGGKPQADANPRYKRPRRGR